MRHPLSTLAACAAALAAFPLTATPAPAQARQPVSAQARQAVSAQARQATAGEVPIAARGRATPIFYDAADAAVVGIAARAFAEDVERVSGARVAVSTAAPTGDTVVIAGTIGSSPLIDRLKAQGRLDTRAIDGKWESYAITTIDRPMPGVGRALVIAGSDRRGTAYGLFELSRRIGVSPWVWWADVKPKRRSSVSVAARTTASAEPSVRYRGIFINDEDWSLRPWAANTMEPERGNVGPRTYAKVFELLLRLRANLLWPGMHQGTIGFNQIAENAALADRYAIVMSASHAEPMLRNNVAEWDFARRGDYNYFTNGKSVLDYWRERVRSNGRYENMYGVGMRGVHDSGIVSGKVDQVKLLEGILSDQRGLFRSELKRDPATIPQLFVVYKEVLDTYRRNMRVPGDITLGWVDDNYGYIRQLSTSAEQQRPGGAGVYYHISYWGVPYDYLWLDTTPPALIEEEMGKAYATNARRAWVVNVGDIKPGERGAEYFLDLAYDYPDTAALGQTGWLRRWADRHFGIEADAIAGVMDDYYRLGFDRKPEHTGFNHYELGVHRTEFSPVAYGDEAARRMADYARLDERATAIEARLAPEQRDAFYHLVLYPIRGSRLINEKALEADRSYLYAYQGRASANDHAAAAVRAYNAVHAETARYNATAGGKWKRFMDDAPRDMSVFLAPPTASATPNAGPGLGVAVEGSVEAWSARPARAGGDYREMADKWRTAGASRDALPVFERATGTPHFVDVFNTGRGALSFTAAPSAPWIVIDRRRGEVTGEARLWVSIDWSKLPAGQTASGAIRISAGGESHAVTVSARNVTAPAGMAVEDDGVVSLSAGRFVRNVAVNGRGWGRVRGLGRSGDSLRTGAAAPSYPTARGAPYAEYRFRSTGNGAARVRASLMPTFPLNAEHKLRYAVSIDGAPAKVVDVEAGKDWEDGAERNETSSFTAWGRLTPGEHRLRVYALDPGLVLSSLVVDLGGLRTSYLQPPETIAR